MMSSTQVFHSARKLATVSVAAGLMALAVGTWGQTCPSPVAGSPFSFAGTGIGRNANNVLVHPSNSLLLVANTSSAQVSALNLAPGGSLSFNNSASLTPANQAAGLAMNPTGTFLYVDAFALSATAGSSVHVFSVGPGGALAQVQGFAVPGSRAMNGIVYVTTGSGDFVYVNENRPTGNTVAIYSVNLLTGTLSPMGSVSTGGTGLTAGAFGAPKLAVDSTGTRLYAANQGSNSVSSFAIGAGGALTLLDHQPILEASSGGVAIDPSGTTLYAGAGTSSTTGKIVKFSVSPGGLLTRIGSFNVFATRVVGLQVHPGGNRVAATKVDGAGEVALLDASSLTHIGGSPISDNLASGLTFNGSGSLLFVGHGIGTTMSVSAYLVNCPPSLSVPAPSDLECTAGSADISVSATVSDDDGDPLVVTWKVDSAIVQVDNVPAGSPTSATLTLSATLALGSHTIEVEVSDGVNPSVTDSFSVSVVDTCAAVISLNGDAVIDVECHGTFTDPGATAFDACHGDVTHLIVVTGTVNTSVPGDYVISYDVTDPSENLSVTVTRTVRVRDTVPPDITVLGNNPLVIPCHGTYADPGATAFDECSGDLTSSIAASGTVNPNQVGVYSVTYTVQDGAGNEATATRTVIVKATVVGFFPPMACLVPEGGTPPLPAHAFKQGRTIPLRLWLMCGCEFLTDEDVAPPRIVSIERNGEEVPLETIDPDVGEDEDIEFQWRCLFWAYNLRTRGLPKGTYTITVEMPDSLRYQARFVLR